MEKDGLEIIDILSGFQVGSPEYEEIKRRYDATHGKGAYEAHQKALAKEILRKQDLYNKEIDNNDIIFENKFNFLDDDNLKPKKPNDDGYSESSMSKSR